MFYKYLWWAEKLNSIKMEDSDKDLLNFNQWWIKLFKCYNVLYKYSKTGFTLLIYLF